MKNTYYRVTYNGIGIYEALKKQIWNNKKFYKRNITVQWRINKGKFARYIIFQPIEPGHIKNSIEKDPCVSIFNNKRS